MKAEYEKVFVLLADHKPHRLQDFYSCVDWVDNDRIMQTRARRLVSRVQAELDDNQNHWQIVTKQEYGLAMYRLVQRQKASAG